MDSRSLETLFNPFPITNDTDENNATFSYNDFENIRVACSYHLPENLKNIIANKSNQLNIMHLNSRSIINKLYSISNLLVQTAVDWHIVSVSETWLSRNIEEYYILPGFHGFFGSRDTGAGGGSALYISDQLCPRQLNIPPFTTADAVGASFKLSNKYSVVVCQIYKAPNTDKSQFNSELEQCLIFLNKLNKPTLITGDFNFDLFLLESNPMVHTFFNNMLSHGFFPIISRTTRSAHPSYTLLDNIFCNDLSRVMHSGIILDDMSDHFPVFGSLSLNMSCSNAQKPVTRQVFDYRRINEFNSFLSNNLVSITNEQNPEIIADKIIQVYNEGIQNFSYTKHVSRRNNPRKAWISPAILMSIAHKNQLFKEKLKHPTALNIGKYSQFRNTLNKVIRSAKKKYY